MTIAKVVSKGSLFTSIGLCWNLGGIKVSDQNIIELIPLVFAIFFKAKLILLFNVGVIVTTVSCTSVHNDTN